MKDVAVAALMDAFTERADDTVADWSDVLRRARIEPVEMESAAQIGLDPIANGTLGRLDASPRPGTPGEHSQNGASPAHPRVPIWQARPLRIALVVLALGAVAVAVVLLRGSVASDSNRALNSTSAREVTRRMQSALVDANESIVHSTQHQTPGAMIEVTDSWLDPEGQRRLTEVRVGGKLSLATAWSSNAGKVGWTTVNYENGTWTTATFPPGAPPRIAGGSGDVQQALRDQVSRGDLALVGREQLGGRETLHLVRRPVPNGPTRFDLWVDADSYLPVRSESSSDVDGAVARNVTDYEWLPRTEENIARTRLSLPPGFRRVEGGLSVTRLPLVPSPR